MNEGMKKLTGSVGFAAAMLVAGGAFANDFTYQPPGELVAGSGSGRADSVVYVPGMRFPIEVAPAYANSQVWGRGGSQGGGGGQCDTQNYSYPWWDNFCESRSWEMPLCPSGTGHQGQDIRPSTCENDKHWSVAAEDGQITSIGSYSVYLTADNGTVHRYLHMAPSSVTVSTGDRVRKGQQLGRVSNAFGGTPTTIHLHYDIRQNVSGHGMVYVPTYMSLVRSYQELIGQPEGPCDVLPAAGGIVDDDGPCFMLLGNVGTWRRVEGGHGGSLRWTYAFTNDTPDGYARWSLVLEAAGEYELEAYVTAEFAQSKQARYVVRAAGNQREVRLDQSAEGGWRSLGRFNFAAGDDQWVEIYDNTGEDFGDRLQFVADAIRLTRIEAPAEPGPGPGEPGPEPTPGEPEPEPGPPPGDEDFEDPEDPAGHGAATNSSCACASVDGRTGSGLPWWAAMLAITAGIALRRRSFRG